MKRNAILQAVTGVMALAIAFGTTAPVYAAEDTAEPNPVVAAHPDTTMQPTKTVTPIGSKTFYKIDAATGTVVYADRDDGSGEWIAVPSRCIDNSPYNTDNAHYGMYITGTGADTQVHYVLLADCHQDDAGAYTYYHGTKDAASVSKDVDTATNAKPDMSTDFYVNVENGIDPDGTENRVTGNHTSNDSRVDYDVTIATKATYQLKATVPMYVCMYGFRGTGNIVTPTSDAYKLKNYSTINEGAKATVADITKITHYAKIYDENHSNEKLYSIAYDAAAHTYTYWYSDPSMDADWTEPANYLVLADKDINASGEVYVIFIDGKWDFKAAGVLDGDALRETVTAVDANHPLADDLVQGEYNFGKTPAVGDAKNGGTDKGMALKITELQAQPATWKLVSVATPASQLKRGELAMSLAPKSAITDASAIDLSTVSAATDITERGWFMGAPAVNAAGDVDTPTELPVITYAQMAGGNVNAAGCSPVTLVTYTLTPLFEIGNGETNTVSGSTVSSNYNN